MTPRGAGALVDGTAYRNPGEAAFFRDAGALLSLKTLMRKRLGGARDSGRPFRAWVPKCESGPDAYSVAITLLEAMGTRWREIPLCVFATDTNADAVAAGRAARYGRLAVDKVPKARLARYFTEEQGQVRPRAFVRDACRFVRHDCAQPLPFARLDLIACRSLLGEAAPQARRAALSKLHAALVPGGVLVDRSGAAALAPDLFAPTGKGGAYTARPAILRDRHPATVDRSRESQEQFQKLFSRAKEAALILDAATGRILEANDAAASLYGWSVTKLLGMSAGDLLAPESSAARTGPERRSAAREHLPRHRRKDGTSFPVDSRTSFVMHEGRPCHLVMERDASPRLRKESGSRSQEARDAFLGEVIHELRNPLAVIRGSAEILRRGGSAAKDRKAYLGFIENSSTRMSALVDRLLDLSAAETLQRPTSPVRLPLSTAVWEIAAAFRPIATRRAVKIRIDIPGDLTIHADPADLPHIFGNLLDNAIKFSPRGGRVSVNARAHGGEARVSVRDGGPGVASADLERIFERFYRAASARRVKGTGLGLAIVRAMAEANRGGVVAENAATRGTTFTVTLPLAAALTP